MLSISLRNVLSLLASTLMSTAASSEANTPSPMIAEHLDKQYTSIEDAEVDKGRSQSAITRCSASQEPQTCQVMLKEEPRQTDTSMKRAQDVRCSSTKRITTATDS